MTPDRFDKLLAFVQRLEAARIPFQLRKTIEDAISVLAFAPGEYWEIDFWADGKTYVERFRSNGIIDDDRALEELFALWADDQEQSVTPHGASARK